MMFATTFLSLIILIVLLSHLQGSIIWDLLFLGGANAQVGDSHFGSSFKWYYFLGERSFVFWVVEVFIKIVGVCVF